MGLTWSKTHPGFRSCLRAAVGGEMSSLFKGPELTVHRTAQTFENPELLCEIEGMFPAVFRGQLVPDDQIINHCP